MYKKSKQYLWIYEETNLFDCADLIEEEDYDEDEDDDDVKLVKFEELVWH